MGPMGPMERGEGGATPQEGARGRAEGAPAHRLEDPPPILTPSPALTWLTTTSTSLLLSLTHPNPHPKHVPVHKETQQQQQQPHHSRSSPPAAHVLLHLHAVVAGGWAAEGAGGAEARPWGGAPGHTYRGLRLAELPRVARLASWRRRLADDRARHPHDQRRDAQGDQHGEERGVRALHGDVARRGGESPSGLWLLHLALRLLRVHLLQAQQDVRRDLCERDSEQVGESERAREHTRT